MGVGIGLVAGNGLTGWNGYELLIDGVDDVCRLRPSGAGSAGVGGGGIDSFHIDIMDGRYVPNYAMSLNDMRYIAGATSKPLDVHLMIEHPNNTIQLFLKDLRPGDTVYIHPEAEYHSSTTLQEVIDAGMIPGIAINPSTSVETVMEMLRIVKKVLVMTVNLGNAGHFPIRRKR